MILPVVLVYIVFFHALIMKYHINISKQQLLIFKGIKRAKIVTFLVLNIQQKFSRVSS